MERIEKTVFISYRRTNAAWVLAVYQDLYHHGYDVFYDRMSIASGDFERVIVENIKARAHFLVLLTPSALEHCENPADWLRREIEAALDNQRNIVPLMLEGFDFSTPQIASQLKGKLAEVAHYNALPITPEFFFEAMERLRSNYLNVPLSAVLHPASSAAQTAAIEQKSAASAAPPVQEKELAAEQWFERGFVAAGLDEKLRCYDEALRLKPDFAEAFTNRGVARWAKGDRDEALADFTKVLRLKPDHARALRLKPNFTDMLCLRLDTPKTHHTKLNIPETCHIKLNIPKTRRLKLKTAKTLYNQGFVRIVKGDLDGALADFTTVLRLKPDHAKAFNNRGVVLSHKGDLDRALADFTEALRLKPDYAEAFTNRGVARWAKGDLNGALTDFTKALSTK